MSGQLSPYERALGASVECLHPRLRTYFAALPAGAVGRGSGTFDVVGTPRVWTWPLLAVLARWGIAFPVWQADVPFTVENRSTAAGAVEAVRVFRLRGGDRAMVDAVAFTSAGLVDALGVGGRVRASFRAGVVDGALVLDSHRFGVRVGRMRTTLPPMLSPRVRLVESFDDAIDLQRVDVTIDLPVIGRIYRYAGSFAYAVHHEGEQ